MAVDVFSKYLITVPQRQHDTISMVRALLSTLVPKHNLKCEGTDFTSELLTELAKEAGIQISQATNKHAQTIGMVE